MNSRFQNRMHEPNTTFNVEWAQAEFGPWFGSATNYCNVSSQYDAWSRSVGFGLKPPSTKYIDQYQSTLDCLSNDCIKHASSKFIKSDGNTSFSPMGKYPMNKEFTTSPEQISSVTSCSEADLFSEGEHLDSGSNFSSPDLDHLSRSSLKDYTPRPHVNPGLFGLVDQREILETNQIASYDCFAKPFVDNMELCHSNAFMLEKIPERRFNSLSDVISGNIMSRRGERCQVPPNACILEQISNRISPRRNSLSSMVAGEVIPRHEDQYQTPKLHDLHNCYQLDELSKTQCRESSLGNQIENDVHQHSGSSISMVDDAPPPPKRSRTGDYAHSSLIGNLEDQCVSERTLDKSSNEGSLCYGKKEGAKVMQVCSPETYILGKEKEELYYQGFLNQEMTTEQLLSSEDTLKASHTTNCIYDGAENVGSQNPSLLNEQDNGCGNVHQSNSDITAILDQQNSTQEYTSKPEKQPNVGIKYFSKPQEEPKIIQEPGDMQCCPKPLQLESKVEIDSRECATSHQLTTISEDLGKLPVSCIDFFNSEEIEEHIRSLQLSLGKPSGTIEETPKENWLCRLCCSSEKLLFGPPPLYCSRCFKLVKPNTVYYWAQDEMGSRHCFCTACIKQSRGTISFQGLSFSRAQMWKETNNIENEESWVQCDKCEQWMHQICGLFNAKGDPEGKAKYACPYCRLEEIKLGKHVPSRATFEARDLPRTGLSDHIEQRLFRELKKEREERAKASNKDIDEVPGVGELVVRVVSSVSKILKVNQEFLDIIPDQDYPQEFPYRSKVILLFQKIEGIDVCLFCMYVQEYGSECDKPNQRSVYISYLDSIKYFRPEIHTATGEALRTFMYHEILIGYLDYCKKRGFATCYVWACPPYRREDYIFNCHPVSQKIPKPDKLRQWYTSMLKKAMKDEVVVDYKSFYESFFIQNEECNKKITAAHLPYFDGDYWSDAAEDILRKMRKENCGETEGKVKKPLSKRFLKSMGHMDLNTDATQDILVMQKLTQSMLTTRENFLVVQLLFTCKNCQNLILSGGHLFCNQCYTFQFCSRCLEMDPNFKESNMHISSGGEEHLLSKVMINDLPADTAEEDSLLRNDIFENRNSFLSFCQGNNYQFDTLRRAKHSSMMILYDLRKQMRILRKKACSICQKETMVWTQWHSEIRPEFDVCDKCCCKVGRDDCSYNSVKNIPEADRGVKKYEALPEMEHQVRYRNALEHASKCSTSNICLYPDCIMVRRLFQHLPQCKKHLAGGCKTCWKIWMMIHLHAVKCKDTICLVPRCSDVKRHIEECCSGRCRFCHNWRRFVARFKVDVNRMIQDKPRMEQMQQYGGFQLKGEIHTG